MNRQPRVKNERHLAYIRTLPCIISGDDVTVEAAHVRFNDPRIAKTNPGSHKPHDYFVVPLSSELHRKQHTMNEIRFWQSYDIDPILYALALYAVTGDYERGCQIVACARRSLVENVLAAG